MKYHLLHNYYHHHNLLFHYLFTKIFITFIKVVIFSASPIIFFDFSISKRYLPVRRIRNLIRNPLPQFIFFYCIIVRSRILRLRTHPLFEFFLIFFHYHHYQIPRFRTHLPLFFCILLVILFGYSFSICRQIGSYVRLHPPLVFIFFLKFFFLFFLLILFIFVYFLISIV